MKHRTTRKEISVLSVFHPWLGSWTLISDQHSLLFGEYPSFYSDGLIDGQSAAPGEFHLPLTFYVHTA